MQLSAIPQIQELAALMQAHSVTRCVLCPGSRNAPIVRTLATLPGITSRSVTDERSAGFIALGWAAAQHAAVAVCVTSGSALLNLHAAVAEAYYRHIPLLILSADRPTAWIGQQDGQTLPQPGVFGPLTPCSVQLPETMQSADSAWHTNRLINEALIALKRNGGTPAHINIPLSEPLSEETDTELPAARIIRHLDLSHPSDTAQLAALVDQAPRRLLLLGQQATPPTWVSALAAKGWAIAGEHLSNAQGLAQIHPDQHLGPNPDPTWVPDLLLTCGGCLISKPLKQLLRQTPPHLHLHLSADGSITDTFRCLTHSLQGTPGQLIHALHNTRPPDSTSTNYAARWQTKPPAAVPLHTIPWGSTRAVGELMATLHPGDTLHLANSSAVRHAQQHPLLPGVQIECNRGVNGIEGCLSTAVGYALASPGRQFLIIGDLAFFYDMNALSVEGIRPNLRILLLNDHTGGIFSTLPGRPCPMVAGHSSTSAKGWAQACGFQYQTVQTPDQWPQALALLSAEHTSAPVLIELDLTAS